MKIKISKYVSALKKYKHYNSIVTIIRRNKYLLMAISGILCICLVVIVAMSVKSSLTTKVIDKDSIASNAAEEYFYNGNYDDAIDAYTKMQEKDSWPIWNVKIAEIYSAEGELVKSNEILQKAYETRNMLIDTKKEKIDNLKEKDKELSNYIAYTFLMNGEYKKALEYGEMFMQDYPDDKQLLKTMFTVYLVNGQNDKAKDMISNLGKEDLVSKDLAELARMNALINNSDEALSLLQDAWNKDKDEVKVFDVLAEIVDSDKTVTLDKISKLQKENPDETLYKMWMAKIYSMSKDSAEKSEKLIEELDDDDNAKGVNLELIKADMYQSLGDIDNLNEVLDEVRQNNSKSYIGYYAGAWLAYNNENYDEAFKDCEKSINLNRDYLNNYYVLIPEIMNAQDKNDNTQSYFRTALYKDPSNYEIINISADYYSNTLKNSTQGLFYYDLASKMDSKDSDAYYNMAILKNNTARYDEAINLVKKSIAINDKSPKYHRALGAIYINKQKNDDAIKEIRTAYNLDKNDIRTLNDAGCYYISVEGDISRGLSNLKSAYDGINENTSQQDKDIITDNYNRINSLSDAYTKKSGSSVKITDLRLIY